LFLSSTGANELETNRLPLHRINSNDRKEVYYSLGGEGVGGGGKLSHFERAALRKRLKRFERNLSTWKKQEETKFQDCVKVNGQ
jgi:hypothetical protein